MILESSQAAQPRSVTWSWLIYGFLLLARVFVAPHLPGYVHPDEFFQGGQELWFGCPPGVPWEFQPQNALRSVVPPLIMTWIPLWMFAAVTQQSTEYLSGYEVLVVPRIFCSLLSVLCVDVAVWKLSAAESSKGGVPVPNLLLASSWPTMVMLSRPFSNTLETICLAMLLATIGTAVRTAEKSNDRLPFTFWFSARVGCICAVGLFTRFTFALFAFPALVFLLYEMIAAFGRAGARCGLWSPLFWMTVFFIFASMGIIAKDTHFYQTLQTGESSGNEMTNPVLTPINALLYNSQVSNLKDHGLHPRWTHAIVNMLILYGPLAFAGYLFIMAAMAAKSPKPPKVQILSLMVATGGLTLLSAAPHQEPRFILPVLVPLVIIGSAAVAVKNQRIFVFLWVTFNFILLLFFGVLHQSGVQKSLLGISSKIPKIDPTIWIYWKTYMPPTFLSRTQENSLGCASNFHVVDLKGSSQLVLFDRIKMQLQCQEHVTPPTVVYLVTPYQVCNSSITNSNYAFAGDEECKLPGDLWRCRYVSSFGPHLTTEDVPPFDGSFAAFYERMSLNLYEISCK
jgi:phosphatidylinositol glycan class Z